MLCDRRMKVNYKMNIGKDVDVELLSSQSTLIVSKHERGVAEK